MSVPLNIENYYQKKEPLLIDSIIQTRNTPYLEYKAYIEEKNYSNDIFIEIRIYGDSIFMGLGYSSIRATLTLQKIYNKYISIDELIKILNWKIPEHSLLI